MTNQTVDAILARRSIRRFDAERSVDRKTVSLLLECACAAPSAGNRRPWHFIVVDERRILDQLSELHPYAGMLKTAPLAVAVCGETRRGDKTLDWWEEDCSAAMENLLLAAEALSLGAVWLGVRHGAGELENRIRTALGVPDPVAVLGIAAIGWPSETKDPHSGVDAGCLHVNKW
jgi:nitroreductase